MGMFTQSQTSFMGTIKSLNPRVLYRNIQLMNINWVDLGTFFASGILFGFLCKRYLKDVITWLLVCLVLVILLDYVGIVSIKWETIQGVLGVSPAATVDAWLQSGFAWVKCNVIFVISFVIGFTIGIKVG